MSTAAILSIKPVYSNQILAGTKTIELRKSTMGLNPGDVVVVYSSAPEQVIKFWFVVKEIETLRVSELWDKYQSQLGIGHEEYEDYFRGQESAVALHVGQLHPVTPIPLKQLIRLVPGFVPPQGLVWLRDDFGKFEPLVSALSTPLPGHLFAQHSFAF